ncbi:putative imidazolonepropionase isoform X2 [Tubulanus polymorphus]|uniref:putative imidazolonepropionase isoform X2 n=1 Tax=Tubulanus polymorphus TaxID=672921 RepID=UPI003DA50F1C
MAHKLLIHGADQVVMIAKNGERSLSGDFMRKLAVINRKTEEIGVSIAVDRNGKIFAVGTDDVVRDEIKDFQFQRRIFASGMSVIPGLIDAHTHPVWAGDRVDEFSLKLAGASYMQVHQGGGGIHFTVDKTTKASTDELYTGLVNRLNRMLRCGTTLVECKTGYGLLWETELKMLEVINKAKTKEIIDISTTYCAAHAIPQGKSAEEATDDIVNNHIPRIDELMKSGRMSVDNIDVFCEKGVFNIQQSEKILRAGKKIGLNINFHGDELFPLNSAKMGAEIGATAISHLEEISDNGILEMARNNCVAVILPTTAYILRLKAPPVRKMIDNDVVVALGTDFNPNAFCLSMPLVMHLACVNLHMSLEEALVASTLNAAASLKKSHTHGSIEIGKYADLIVLDAPRWEHLVYQMGEQDRVIKHVIKSGDVVF